MESRKQEYWWLLALEATLFFSLPFWESTTVWGSPLTHPIPFGLSVVAGATLAMFACHLGPAACAIRRGERWPHWLQVFAFCLGVGYLDTIVSAAWTVAWVAMPIRGVDGNQGGLGKWLWLCAPIALLVTVTIAAFVRAWWRPVVAGGLLFGVGILAWGLAMNWRGLWQPNSVLSAVPLRLDWMVIRGIIFSAAPAAVIAWRIGRIETEPRRIWLSGFAGVWLPVILSATVGTLASQACESLHFQPSLPRGLYWTWIGPNGRLVPGIVATLPWTMLLPALLSAVSLKALAQLVPRWTWPQKGNAALYFGLLLFVVTSLRWNQEGVRSVTASPAHSFWAASLVILGVAAGLSAFVSWRSPKKM